MNQRDVFFSMPDVQSSTDTRQVSIQRVGVRAVRYPFAYRAAGGELQHTVGVWNLDVHLPAEQKGTHMSRFIALLDDHAGALDVDGLDALLQRMLPALDAEAGRIEVSFPYFVRKAAPVSGVMSLLDYEATLIGERSVAGTRIVLQVKVPLTSLCPCSKEISSYGAHNQRSHVTIRAEVVGALSLEELIRVAEDEASCELWGLLKRPDEKYVTERAYDNPKFVEDLVRDIAVRLDREPRIAAYVLEAENFESIHNHSAYALVERDKLAAP
ncbi:GTP cyclohydrolase FolE2 [Caballeronia sp. 15711]|uniref:GTP cyclohydrolase FolE2 n=1 Tax=Caballeronia sp. 15711 TaxID=3391029 RepID=UPI0039E2A297